MGGWIKLEKDLLIDPRVYTIAANASALAGVTHVLGCLAHLWMIADAHIGQDDILALGPDQINHILGAQGFCQLMPQDWLQIIDANHVKLPGFHAHNGPDAKKRAQSAQRTANHKIRANASALPGANADALLDKTRLDKTVKEKLYKKKSAARLPAQWLPSQEDIAYATAQGLDSTRVHAAFSDYWHAESSAKARKLDWSAAWRTWCRNDRGMRKPNGQASAGETAEWLEARSLADAIGFRGPYPAESASSYLRQCKEARDAPPSKSVLKRIEAMRQ